MGNEQPKKLGRTSKSQIDTACLKARIHLELMRDRKNNEIIKGEKQLVMKLKAKSRNKTEEFLLMERVVNGLKYAQAVNQLIADASSLRGQASFLAENVGNQQKIEPWLPQVHTMLYAADHLGLSSLNEFKAVMRALNNPMQAEKYINPQIKQMLAPTPTPYEVNVYVLEMCERNGFQLEEINMVGHHFQSEPMPDQRQSQKNFQDIQKQLAEQFQKNIGPNQKFGGSQGPGNQGFGGNQGGYGGNQGGYGGNQGFNGGNPGGFGGNQGGYGGNQGFNGGPNYGGNTGNTGSFGGQGGFGGNQGGYGGPTQGFGNGNYGGQGGQGNTHLQPQSYDSNPYKGLSNLNQTGPDYYAPSNIEPQKHEQPKEFKSYDSLMKDSGNNRNTSDPIYPSVNPNSYEATQPYQPTATFAKDEQPPSQPQQQASDTKSPTISQIMRDFDVK